MTVAESGDADAEQQPRCLSEVLCSAWIPYCLACPPQQLESMCSALSDTARRAGACSARRESFQLYDIIDHTTTGRVAKAAGSGKELAA